MKFKQYLVNVVLVLIALCLSVIILEIGFRIILFSGLSSFGNLRKAANYADHFSDDDYWKLVHIFGRSAPQPHPVLGWTNSKFSRDTYLHQDIDQMGKRRPVLLYGDSFAGCSREASCFQDILNVDEEFSKDHYLLNYGVGSYGLDQIFLLFQNSVDLYEDPFVVFSFMTFDLDRSLLTVRSGQKPYFRVEDDELILKGMPINANAEEFFSNNPPQIRSYIYRRILYGYAPKATVSVLRNDQERINGKKAINEKIIQKAITELRAKELDFVFLIFHPNWPGKSTLSSESDWRDPFLRKLLQENDVPYIWSKELFQQDTQGKSFMLRDGHPNSYFNQLIAEEIKRYTLENP